MCALCKKLCVHYVRRGVISQRAWSLGCEVVREGAGYDPSRLREGEGSWNETWNGAFRVPGGDRRGSLPALCDHRQGQSPVINRIINIITVKPQNNGHVGTTHLSFIEGFLHKGK